MASALLGAALMFTRIIFGTEPPMAHSDHLVGALIATVAVMAMAEVGRLLRFINAAFGLWLVAAPWILDGASKPAAIASLVLERALELSLGQPAVPDEHLAKLHLKIDDITYLRLRTSLAAGSGAASGARFMRTSTGERAARSFSCYR